MSDRKKERDRYIDTQRQIYKVIETNSETGTQKGTQTQRDREKERQIDRETERQRDRETERQRDRETETAIQIQIQIDSDLVDYY